MLEVGSVIAEKLRVERVLGSGGMGVVVAATHLQLEQLVAVKVLHETLARDAAALERFLREARASARLRSEHVCRVTDVGQLEGGAPYIVMELLQGTDLAALVARGPLAIDAAVDHVMQACIALGEAHAAGIVHRDLKPANLFLTRRVGGAPLIKVLDFGIAKAPTRDLALTQSETVMGSPGYMSPEQLRSSRDVDLRTDIWALGVVLYQLVSGRLPFPAESITELAVKVAVDPPAPLEVEPAFREVVWRCLAKAPDERFGDVGALASALAPFGSDDARASLAVIRKLAAPAVDPIARTEVSGGGGPAPGSATTTLRATAGEIARAPEPRRARGNLVRVGGLLAIALAGTAVAWKLAARSDGEPERPEGPSAVAAAPAAAPAATPIVTPMIESPAPGPEPEPEPEPRPRTRSRRRAPTRDPVMPAPSPAPAAENTGDQAPGSIPDDWSKRLGDYMTFGSFRNARDLALAVLAAKPGNQNAMYVLTGAYCMLDDKANALKWAAKLEDKWYALADRFACQQMNIDISSARGKSPR